MIAGIIILIIAIPLLIVSIIQWNRFVNRCPDCEKWGVLQKTGSNTVKGAGTRVGIETRNVNTKTVRGHEYTRSKHYTCKNCGENITKNNTIRYGRLILRKN